MLLPICCYYLISHVKWSRIYEKKCTRLSLCVCFVKNFSLVLLLKTYYNYIKRKKKKEKDIFLKKTTNCAIINRNDVLDIEDYTRRKLVNKI